MSSRSRTARRPQPQPEPSAETLSPLSQLSPLDPLSGSAAPAGQTGDQRRRRRSRGTPRWLLSREDLDGIAQRRCLMVLSVLSGQVPVTDAIGEAQISRGTYYQLEERALEAMLRALTPGSEPNAGGASEAQARRVEELEGKIASLERDKRRMERLLLLTRKVVKTGPLTTGAGRPSRRMPAVAQARASSSTSSGGSASPSSRKRTRPGSRTTATSATSAATASKRSSSTPAAAAPETPPSSPSTPRPTGDEP
jgi:hypothetical protein